MHIYALSGFLPRHLKILSVVIDFPEKGKVVNFVKSESFTNRTQMRM